MEPTKESNSCKSVFGFKGILLDLFNKEIKALIDFPTICSKVIKI